jgi:hypothetical protein
MKKDKLNELLKAYDEHCGAGEFSPASEFKEKFFAAADNETSNQTVKSKPILWLVGTIAAIAAVIFFSIIPFGTVPNEKIKRILTDKTCQLMQQLKNIFPEKNVGLCLINDELKTFDANEKNPRNIMINYSVQRKSDGKKIKLAIATSSNNSSELDSEKVKGSIWVYQPDNKVLTVDTALALQLDAKTTIKIQASELLTLNKKKFVSEFEYQGQKYQLFQSACRI